MSQWTPERVLALACDAAAVAPARQFASAANWASSGTHEHAVWGEAKGSGAKPYQTAIDLREPAFKCSCPSRKFPCKHALGLMLRFAQGDVAVGVPPGWVVEWLEKRDEKAIKQAAKTELPKADADPEAAAKRAAKRWDNILAGLEECEAFLIDVAGQGLLASQSARSWDQMAARMVDAQAPGVARRLKRIGSVIGVGADWGRSVAGQMGNLALLIEASRRSDSFGDAMRADVRTALGIPLRKEEIGGEKVVDTWDVLGQIAEVEDRITTCRSWLFGRRNRRWAMHLAFSAAGQPFDVRLIPGTAFSAEMEFFPSAWPLRAHLGDRSDVPFAPPDGETWDQTLDRQALALAAQPWIEQQPFHIGAARLGRDGRDWWAIDGAGQAMRLLGADPWPVLAASGNERMELMGEWSGSHPRLLAAWGTWGFVAL